jgi:GDP-mannose 6-dehydrogenase
MLPGAMGEVVVPTLETRAGRSVGHDLGVAVNPEFLREGTAIRDFLEPSMTVVGANDAATAAEVTALYAGVSGPVEVVPPGVAEMVKYADNAFHAMKVAFANEIGIIAKAEGMDGGEVMRLFCLDEKLNLSAAYLRPGGAFGGSCLPKDIRALTCHARQRELRVPLLDALLTSNAEHTRRGLALVDGTPGTRIGILGLAFKAGTDDVRESPVVDLVAQLVGKGHDVRIFDRSVQLGRLTGVNRAFLLEHIPDIARLMVESMDALVAHAEVVVIGNGDRTFADVGNLLRPGQRVIELERARLRPAEGVSMEGIAW